MSMNWKIASLAVFVGGIFIPVVVTFDRLVRRQHDHHLDAWEADGWPRGLFWRPGGGAFLFAFLGSGKAANRCMREWSRRIPTWALGDDEALRLLRRLRALMIAWALGIVVFLVAIAWIHRPW